MHTFRKITIVIFFLGLVTVNSGVQAIAAEKKVEDRLTALEREIAQLKQMVTDLQQQISALASKPGQSKLTPQQSNLRVIVATNMPLLRS